jgi:hypothetical protein
MKSGCLKLIFRKSPIGDKLANHLLTFGIDIHCRLSATCDFGAKQNPAFASEK